MDPPLPARGARRDWLEELTHSVRRELLERGESPPASWIEESVNDLRDGRTPGWLYPPEADGGGLGFYSTRPHAAFGHVHVAPGPLAVERALALVEAIRSDLPERVASLDLGFTGLERSAELELGERLSHHPGAALLERIAMERGIEPSDAEIPPVLPEGLGMYPIRAIPRESLVELDYRAFVGTVDAQLIGVDREEYRRMMDELVSGRLGRFLEAASTALVDRSTGELEGAILTAEQNPHLAVYLDLMVEPRHRRRGLARFLVRWGFRALAALGYTSVRLWVTASNAPARALYESVGFRAVSSAAIYRESRSTGQAHAG